MRHGQTQRNRRRLSTLVVPRSASRSSPRVDGLDAEDVQRKVARRALAPDPDLRDLRQRRLGRARVGRGRGVAALGAVVGAPARKVRPLVRVVLLTLQKRAVAFSGWVFFLISLGGQAPHVLRAHMGGASYVRRAKRNRINPHWG